MTVSSDVLEGVRGEENDRNEMVEPAVPDAELESVGECSCGAGGDACGLHQLVDKGQIAGIGLSRLESPYLQMRHDQVLCYRARAGWIPELRPLLNAEDEIRRGISGRVRDVTEQGVLFRADEHKGAVLERFADPLGNFPPKFSTGSKIVVTSHQGSSDKYGRFPHNEPSNQPSYLRVSVAPKVIVPKKPDPNVLRSLNSEPLAFKSFPTDVQTMAVYDPSTKLWKAQVVPFGEIGSDHWERMYHYPDGFITGMVFYTGENGIYGLRIDKHIQRACRDAKRRGFDNVSPAFLQKLFSEQLQGDKRWIPQLGNQPGNRYYGRFIGYPTNSAPPLRGKEKEMLFLGTPVGPYRNVQMLNIRQMGPRPVVDGFGDVKHVTNYAGPVEIFAPYQDAGYHEAMFMGGLQNGEKRVQEGTSVNYAFVYNSDGIGRPTVKIPSLKHRDILPGITMQSVAELAASYGFDVETSYDITDGDIASADEILVTGTAMTVRGVGRIDNSQGHPIFESKTGETMGPVAGKMAADFQAILKRQHPDPYFNGWMQKVASF